MRTFLAGASGVIGVRLIPLLREAGHQVIGLTRFPEKAERLSQLGCEPVVCDVFDASALLEAIAAARGPSSVLGPSCSMSLHLSSRRVSVHSDLVPERAVML